MWSLVESSLCVKWIIYVVEKGINNLVKSKNDGLSGAAARTKFLNIIHVKKLTKVIGVYQ